MKTTSWLYVISYHHFSSILSSVVISFHQLRHQCSSIVINCSNCFHQLSSIAASVLISCSSKRSSVINGFISFLKTPNRCQQIKQSCYDRILFSLTKFIKLGISALTKILEGLMLISLVPLLAEARSGPLSFLFCSLRTFGPVGLR